MKQILYFLIGVLISACLISPFAHAECTDISTFKTNFEFIVRQSNPDVTFSYSHATTQQAAYNQVEAFRAGRFDWGVAPIHRSSDGVNAYYYGLVTATLGSNGTWVRDVFCCTYGDFTICADDSDQDGLSDKYDFYPNDPTDYKIQLLSYQEDAAGNRVRECYNTDRGDIFCIGNEHDDTLLDNISMSSDWKDSDDIVTSNVDVGDDGVIDDPQISETSVTPDVYTKSDGTPDDVGSDPEMGSGTGSDGTESVADQKIIDNTAVIAGNVSRLADHLSTQTSKLGNIDYSTAKMANSLSDLEGSQNDLKNAVTGLGNSLGTAITGLGTGITGLGTGIDNLNTRIEGIGTDIKGIGTGINGIKGALDGRAASDAAESASGQSELQGIDPNSKAGDFNGDLVEGDDYQPVESLEDKGWFSEFIESNPYKTMLDSSGFDCSSADCTMSFNLSGPLGGSYSFSICEFSDDFISAGNILLALCTLSGLMLLVRS